MRLSLSLAACALWSCTARGAPPRSPSEAGAPNTVTVADPNAPPALPVHSEPKAGTLPRSADPAAPPPSPLAAPEPSGSPAPARPSAPADPAPGSL